MCAAKINAFGYWVAASLVIILYKRALQAGLGTQQNAKAGIAEASISRSTELQARGPEKKRPTGTRIFAARAKGDTMLKPVTVVTAIALLGVTFSAVPASRLPQRVNGERSINLVGEIMDSRCAIDGSHDKMSRQNGTKNAKDCTLNCARTGGSFVLFDPETESVYQLDDQQKPTRFAGQRVRVSGMYDEPSKTMHVDSIESAE